MDQISSPPAPAENTAQKQRGRPFEPGNSGNPHGRLTGSRNKTMAVKASLLDGEAAALARRPYAPVAPQIYGAVFRRIPG